MGFIDRFFLPKNNIFFDILKDISKDQIAMAELLAKVANNFEDLPEIVKKAKDLEHSADTKTHRFLDHLNKNFITPLDREDLYVLAHTMDDIIDLMENVIRNFVLYEVKETKPCMSEFASLILECSKCLDQIIDFLPQQRHLPLLVELKIKIHELEDKGDALFDNAIHSLFAGEKDPIAVIKWKDILENYEKVLDTYQHVADTIEGIIVKSN